MTRVLRSSHLGFVLLVLLQATLVSLVIRVNSEDPLSFILALGAGLPFFVLALIQSPGTVLLAAPLLVIIPGTFVGLIAAEMIVLAAILAAAIRGLAAGAPSAPVRWIEAIFVFYVGWSLLAVFQAVELRIALEGLKRTIFFLLTFIAGLRVIGASRAGMLVRVVALLGVAIAVQLLLVMALNGYAFFLLSTRIGILTYLGWGYSNYVAAVGALTAAAALPLLLYGGTRDRILGSASLLAAGFLSIATVSRGGTLALVFALLLTAILEARRRFALTLSLIVLVAGGYLLSPLGQAGIARFVQVDQMASVGIRLIYYRETMTIARDHWLLGVGPDQIPFHTPVYMDRNPHNFLLKNAADLGVPGLLLHLAVFGVAVAAARRWRKRARTRQARMESLTLALVLGVAFFNALYEPTLGGSAYGVVYWLLVGSLLARSELPEAVSEASS